MNKEVIKKELAYLKTFSCIDKCEKCECLHGALAKLYTECKDHELKNEIKQMISKDLHSCLGCEYCPPAEIFVKEPGCGDCCG